MLEIDAIAKNEHRITPDIGGNLKLPENEQFSILIQRRHTIIMQAESVKSDGGFSFLGYLKPCIKRLENPPMLNFGDMKRAMTINDIFEIPQLEPVLNAIFDKVNELKAEVNDTKN
jgi:hypothetical protein